MVENILIFSLETCSHCKNLKKRLDELSIPYVPIDIQQNKDLWDKVKEETKHNVVPTIFFKMQGTDSGPIYVPGRDYKDEDEIVEIIKSHI